MPGTAYDTFTQRRLKPPGRQQPARLYPLELDGARVAWLYVMPNTFTLSWPTSVGMERFERSALPALLEHLSGDPPIDLARGTYPGVQATVVTRDPNDGDELLRYDLSDPTAAAAYRERRPSFGQALFLRYDVGHEATRNPFSITLRVQADGRPRELAVRFNSSARRAVLSELHQWATQQELIDNITPAEVDIATSAAEIAEQIG